ncbi:MAG: gliding motility protein GldL [Paludibacter sp.]|nr:gliding motility protein GldL [Paludibacter sp.]
MSEQTKFDLWWNSPKMKRIVGAAYSLGASVVILGAMFKILHLNGASYMLGIGMSVEAIIFALGIFDKPVKEFEWNKVFDFESEKLRSNNLVPTPQVESKSSLKVNYSETISDEDVKKLSEGIKNLSATADQLNALTSVVKSTDKLTSNLDNASEMTSKFIHSQEQLNNATSQLQSSYQSINNGMEVVDKNTKHYASKVEEINKNLSSINSVYEIQLKNIQAQSEGLTKQNDLIKAVSADLNQISTNVDKMKLTTQNAAEQTELYKSGTEKLVKQVADLNLVYGNMLNALS